jgi:hypothetical protein
MLSPQTLKIIIQRMGATKEHNTVLGFPFNTDY